MNWKIKKLGECCISIADGDHMPPPKSDSGVPFVTIGNIDSHNHFDFSDTMYVPQTYYDNLDSKRKAVCGDVLLTVVGSFGIPILISDSIPFVFQRHIAILRPNADVIDSRFLYYTMLSKAFYAQADTYAIGAAQRTISLTSLRRMKISVPPMDIQNRIADALSMFDALIENNNKRIKVLEQMAESLYKEWFVRFRFPRYEDISLKKQTPSGWVISSRETDMVCPESWKYGSFSKLGSFVRGKNITAAEMVEGDIPVVSAGLEPSGYHNAHNVTGKSLTISASGANAGYLKYHLSDIWAADCSYFQDDKKLWFVYNALKFLQPVISNLKVGAAQPHVYPKNINKLCTVIPDYDTIQAYCDKVEPIYGQIKLLKEKNENLTKQRDMLLPRLMSGKLKV